jgi:hypothetical protein
MASSGKKKTTMAKLNRERKLRERRIDKQFKKDARKNAPAVDPEQSGETVLDADGLPVVQDDDPAAVEPAAEPLIEV